jgi:hypothetical protein
MPQFEVEIGGNIAPITKSLADLKSRLKELQFDISKSTDAAAITLLNKELRETEQEIKRIKNIGPILPPSAANSIASAATATQNFGRVAQDLPFGFIGIQNNLNPLLESFQRLRAEAGSNKAALKALASSLTGAGGVGLALSLVSSAFLIFQNGIAGFNSKTKEAKEKADKLKEVLRDIALISGEAAAGTEGQVSQVNALAAVVNNTNKSYHDRKRALEELKEVNKAYFGDLQLEDAVTGKLAATIKEYTNALINSAIQKEFITDIAKVAKAVVEGDVNIEKARTKLARAQAAEIRAQELANATRKEGVTIDNVSINAKRKVTQAEKELSIANEAVTDLLTQEALLRGNLNKAVEEGLKFKDLDSKSSKKEEDFLKKRLDALEKVKKGTEDATALVGIQEAIFDLQVKIAIRDDKKRLNPQEFDQLINGFKKELQDAFLKQALSLEAIPKVKFSPTAFAEIPKQITDVVSKATGNEKITVTLHDVRVRFLGKKKTKILEGTEAINKQLSEDINSSLENLQLDLSGSLGETIGEAFATAIEGGDISEGLKNAAKAMLGILGTTMQQIGRQVIAAAIKIQVLKKTLEQWAIANPGLAIIAGIGLVAAGAALKNFSFQGPKFAKGGIVTGPTIGMMGEAGKEAIIPLNKLGSMIGANGGTTVVLRGSLGIRGRELVAFLEQEQNRFNRIR